MIRLHRSQDFFFRFVVLVHFAYIATNKSELQNVQRVQNL